MLIHRNMDLDELADLMGSVASRDDARVMRDELVRWVNEYANTDDIPNDVWTQIMDRAFSVDEPEEQAW